MPPNTPAVAPGQVPSFSAPDQIMPVRDVTIVIGYTTTDGQRSEVTHEVGPGLRIVGFVQGVVEKMQKTKDDDGRLLGFEPTGEYELTLKVKYTKG